MVEIIEIIKSSRLVKAAALLEYPTTPVTRKLILTFVVEPLIKVLSKYGESGTSTIDGLVIVSGIPLYTFAAIDVSAVCNGVRMSASMVIDTSFQLLKMDPATR